MKHKSLVSSLRIVARARYDRRQALLRLENRKGPAIKSRLDRFCQSPRSRLKWEFHSLLGSCGAPRFSIWVGELRMTGNTLFSEPGKRIKPPRPRSAITAGERRSVMRFVRRLAKSLRIVIRPCSHTEGDKLMFEILSPRVASRAS